MKRLSADHKAYLLRRAKQHRDKKKRRSVSRRAALIARAVGVDLEGRKVQVYRDGQYSSGLILGDARPAPALLSFSKNYEETAIFLGSLRDGLVSSWRRPPRQNWRSSRQPVVYRQYWDFTTIREISVPVALVIAAEYDRIRKSGGWRPAAIDYENWHPDVRSMLDQIGFLSLAGVNPASSAVVAGDGWRLLKFQSGFDTTGERAHRLLADLGLDTALDSPELYEALIEALANIKHHAYPKHVVMQPPYVAAWWMTGMIDSRNRTMTIVVCDQGMTIPGSLCDPEADWELRPNWSKLLMRATGRIPGPDDRTIDGAAIAAAMKVGRTSTGLSYRGRGLRSYEKVLDACAGGSLSIRSRSGEYRKAKNGAAEYRSHATPLQGTVISWLLRV